MKPKITILGAGESGIGASLLAKRQGYDTFVSSLDTIVEHHKLDLEVEGIAFEEGCHTLSNILASSLIVKSPGIHPDIDVLKRAHAKNIEIIDEIEFAFRHIKGKVIAISGTNGKTTVSRLLYHLVQQGCMDVALAGNIGVSLSRKLLENDRDWYIVEVSSFQLEGIKTFKPDIAILLNITPDHLNRYDYVFQRYIDTKFRLVQNTTETDIFIYNADDPHIKNELAHNEIRAQKLGITLTDSPESAAFFDGLEMHFSFRDNTFSIPYKQTTLEGAHNCVNVMAAALAAYTAGVSTSALREGLATFVPSPHRLEWITTIGGIRFVNDSKATNVHAVLKALETYDTPLIWIAGGVDKGNDYNPIRKQVHNKVKALLCLGTDNNTMRDYFAGVVPCIEETTDMDDVVNMAWKIAKRGDVILLSPACSSFDLFTDYEDRGNRFRYAVRTLEANVKSSVQP